MSESLFLTAAVSVAKPRLRAYLSAPALPASQWPHPQWAGVTGGAWGSRDELPAAIAECDRWIDGDAAAVFRELDEDELLFRFDEATGSLAVDLTTRVDFRLPSLIWSCTVLRGLTAFMAAGDHGIVTVTADWSDDTLLMLLAPDHTAFLDRDARARAEAKAQEIDIRSAACDADQPGTATEVIDWLLDD
ncbi:hypothetical protein OHA72_59060 [Dactylosporangium sp. NBC_01737]|uniref:hypothetical protein n=1 Tax=Dactylosporangium sp. NBC_01737 TaxID=2975959 RepID=UPI002E15C7FC|nr:hypothetical protein OHA72_59060 [Dactylosporangium sp. NBC_01737]